MEIKTRKQQNDEQQSTKHNKPIKIQDDLGCSKTVLNTWHPSYYLRRYKLDNKSHSVFYIRGKDNGIFGTHPSWFAKQIFNKDKPTRQPSISFLQGWLRLYHLCPLVDKLRCKHQSSIREIMTENTGYGISFNWNRNS